MKTITAQFQGSEIHFHDDGWFNATEAAEKFGKRLQNWFDNKETKEYIAAVAAQLNHSNESDLVRTVRGKHGGTWLHPKLAVALARWLDVKFAVWCDSQIEKILRGEAKQTDWRRVRHEAAASYKVMATMLKEMREDEGKGTATFHYANEAKLVNFAICGQYTRMDRESLTFAELDLLARLEVRNTILLARGMGRDERREQLLDVAKLAQAPALGAPS